MENVINNPTFKVEEETSYCLTIIFGDAQIGYSTLKTFDNQYHSGQIICLRLGKGSQIIGRSLLISSLVTDVNPHTNNTSITYKLNNQIQGPYHKAVGTDNSSLYYTANITFIK